MASIKDRIIEFDSSVPAEEVADELDTSTGYVYKVRSEARREPPETDRESSEPGRDADGEVTGVDMDITESDPSDAEESPLSDLVIEDEYESYECECGAPLEYLQDECPECGAEPAWWAE